MGRRFPDLGFQAIDGQEGPKRLNVSIQWLLKTVEHSIQETEKNGKDEDEVSRSLTEWK